MSEFLALQEKRRAERRGMIINISLGEGKIIALLGRVANSIRGEEDEEWK